jgi:hypothetical protein
MKAEVLLEQLETAAEALAVKVSYEPILTSIGHGGLCRVKGQYRVIIDKRATPQERVITLAAALSSVATAEQLAELHPKVQDVITRSPDGSRTRAA